jgi:hypothetical protein
MAKVKTYEGVVVFGSDGVHYAVGPDGHADPSRPLRWDGGGFRPAVEGEALHNDTHHAAELELEVGGEA